MKNKGTRDKYIGTTNGLKGKKLKENKEKERSRIEIRQVGKDYKVGKLLLNTTAAS